ncbi:cohesin complex subunit [Recurvomyces mirabilis]|uniref:Cohesin complex subunit n=1 Tax=Recurvomyces mirabilis TaxID=574656 RepID=A0AAE0WYM4_9PEZI|nr:cohesin complex subunit [Recurvomyces mirabilis]KAK5162307.1 cohesin complex subunit [Recurvomyces mirabilis]
MPGRLLEGTSTPLQVMDASAINKRASGRVRRQPDHFATNAFSSSAKRKRDDSDNDDEERGMPEDYGSDENAEGDDDEQESDEEEMREKNRLVKKAKRTALKKSTQKQAKTNGVSLPTRPARRKAPRKAKAFALEDADSAGGLYAEVFAGSQSMADVAGQWLRRFDQEETPALAEIVTFIVRCTGCEGEVTEHDIEDPDSITNKLNDLRDEYQATNPTDYPLIVKGKAATTFKQGLVSFFDSLIKSMAVKGTLYDNPILVENVQMWVSTMSSAPNRSFRHTATVIAMTIVTALCEVGQENLAEAAKDQQQADKERKKARPNQGRIKQMEQNGKERTRLWETIDPMLKDWFDVVFVHRYRDIDPAIRRECVAALGEWIMTVPEVYYDGTHLRYLGWVLSDTAATTRAEVLKQLHRLYKDTDSNGMKNFTEKFRPRLVEIATTDAEPNIRISGIELLDVLRERGLLEPDDVDAVGRMVFDTDAKIRKTVATFFSEIVKDLYNSKIDELGGLEALEEVLPDAGNDNDVPRLEWLLYKSIAEMLSSYDSDDGLPAQMERNLADGRLALHLSASESRFMLATDALYDKLEEIGHWQDLAAYVLGDRTVSVKTTKQSTPSQLSKEASLDDTEVMVLLEVICASARRNLLSLAEQLKQPKSKLTVRQKEQLTNEQEEAARQLSALVPQLLEKFGDVPSTAAAVLRIESILSLPDLSALQQDATTYSTLLDDVRKQFMSHGADEVLAPASNAILHAKSYGDLQEMTEEKVTALWDDVISNLEELLDPTTVTVRGASQVEELAALSNNLLRIVRLAQVSDCTLPLENSAIAKHNDASGADYQGAIDYIVGLVLRAKPDDGLPDADEAVLEDQVAARAADAALFYLRWKLKSIITAVTSSSSNGVTLEELEALALRRDNFVKNIESALETRKPGEEISAALAGSVLDMFTNAAILRDVKPKPGMSDDYTVLVMDLSPELQNLVMRVFASCEKNYAKLGGKKLEDATTMQDDDALAEDPMSDPESDDEDEEESQTQASQQRREVKLRNALIAEQMLCAFAAKIIHATFAGVVDEDVVRNRLERNKIRLGANFKEVLAYLDLDAMRKKGKKKAKGKGKAARKAKPDPKSHAIVADDNVSDLVEDLDADDDDALRRRGLLDEELEPEEEQVVNGAGEEAESVLGD